MPSEIAPLTDAKPVIRRRSGMFRALSHRDYRLFWTGAFLSNVGTWMQAVAQGWLVLQLTNSPFWLGLDAFMATAPAFIFTLVGGVFADLIDRRRLLLYTQVIAGLAALGLAALVATNVVNRWMVLGFSFVTGCCMALASPSYLAMTYDLVGREDLANAIAYELDAVSAIACGWTSAGGSRVSSVWSGGLLFRQRTFFHRRGSRTLEGATTNTR